jgi:CRISPR/Cas system Type II protein with McrA/HNH and RuvC-like nuclease domain
MANSLYNLTTEFLQVAAQLEEMDLEKEIIADTLEALQLPIEEKAENVIKFVKNLEAMAEARKTEAKRLTELAAKDTKKAEKLLSYLDDNLKMLGKTKLTAGVFQLSYRKGSEVIEIDEAKLPDFYWVPQPAKPMSKVELKAVLKANPGVTIEGVSVVRKPDSLVVK